MYSPIGRQILVQATENVTGIAAASEERSREERLLGLKCEQEVCATLMRLLQESGLSPQEAHSAVFEEEGLPLWDKINVPALQTKAGILPLRRDEVDGLWREAAPPQPDAPLWRAQRYASGLTVLEHFDARPCLERVPMPPRGLFQKTRQQLIEEEIKAGFLLSPEIPITPNLPALLKPDNADIWEERKRRYAQAILSLALVWVQRYEDAQNPEETTTGECDEEQEEQTEEESAKGKTHRPWTINEENQAIALRSQSKSYAEIGKILNRTRYAVYNKLEEEKKKALKNRSNNNGTAACFRVPRRKK